MASTITTIRAAARARSGKGAARADRRAGRLPGVIYGGDSDVAPITVDPKDVATGLATGSFFSTLYDIDLDGKSQHVLPRAVQKDPVSDRPTHVDFLRVTDRTRIAVEVPVHFVNHEASQGIKDGGVLSIVRRTVELSCLAGAIPEFLTVDLTGLEIGDSIHISSISLPAETRPTITTRDFTIASIQPPTVMAEETPAAAAAAEGAAAAPGAAAGAAGAAAKPAAGAGAAAGAKK
ncbi:MAG: 50S ribosomal protein L25/general stress protein Ctc [Alphaproteobacteria bacterium]